MAKIVDIINKAETTHSLTKEEIVDLLRCDEYDQQLFLAADRVRSQYVGDQVHLRGLIEFSNICQQNCFYCGLRKENTKVKRYKLTPDTIIDLANKAKSYIIRRLYYNLVKVSLILWLICNTSLGA